MVILLPLLLVVPLANPPRVVKQSDVDALWEFVQTLTACRNLPPEVYFAREEEPLRSASFLAYYYEHTRVVRVSPLAVKADHGLGSVYVVLGHEMLHYALADQEPVAKHHCLFVQRAYRERIVEFLITTGIGHPALRLMEEAADGCESADGIEPGTAEETTLTGGP